MPFIILFLICVLFSIPVSATYDLNGEWLTFDLVGSRVVGEIAQKWGIAQITQTNDVVDAIWDAAFYG